MAAVDDEVAFSWSALRVTRRDLACLEEGNMLNDAVVDFFLQLMMSQLLPNCDIHLFSTHFYTRLTAAQAVNGEVGWENVKGWTKKASLFSRKLAIVPVNLEMHWWLALIRLDAPRPTLCLLDSLPGEVQWNV
ncbi:ulp2 [Symbiodinium natans]|uniref:Ulp2 protein n=1 Tax=Symbiodinium natans TaxID=878477 RepID=A0A812HX61_9DINO|nr:ulp2 [Symbiodinium natans]